MLLITVAQTKNTQFSHKIIVLQGLNITGSIQNSLLFHPHRPKVSYAIQSMAVLTMLYDKPF